MANIMITDDAMFMRKILSGILTSDGHTIIAEASNGAEAIEKYKQCKPDLVTMDITMPDVDGIEALKGIMSLDPTAKVIMCTAMGQQALVVEAIKNGAKDFMVKPFEADTICNAVNKALQ